MPPPSVPAREARLPHHRLRSTRTDPGPGTRRPCRSSSWASGSASTAPGCATGTCSTASPPPSPCSPPPPSAPGASRWARRSSRWAGRTRCGWPRTSRPSTSCPAAGSTRASASGRRCATTTSGDALYPDTADVEDFSYERVPRLLRFVARRAGQPVPRHRGDRGVLRPGRAALPRPARPHVVRRGQPAVGAVGRGERAELPVQQRRAGRAVGGLRRDPAVAPGDVPGAPPRRRRGPRLAGAGRDPHRQRDAASRRRSTRRTSQARTPRTATPQGPGADDVRPRPGGHVRPDRRGAVRATRGSGRSREVVFALPFSFDHDDYVQILTDIATKLGPALGWRPPA